MFYCPCLFVASVIQASSLKTPWFELFMGCEISHAAKTKRAKGDGEHGQ
jgi:hypothetical protein